MLVWSLTLYRIIYEWLVFSFYTIIRTYLVGVPISLFERANRYTKPSFCKKLVHEN